MDERVSLSKEKTGFVNSYKGRGKKYGSINKKPVAAPHLLQPQSFITHQLSAKDTIQGLALRYGVTPEVIKRVNNLYTNDSIHLKTTLKIPAPDPPSHSLTASQSEDALVRFLNPSEPLVSEPAKDTGSESPSIGPGVPPVSSFDAIIPGLSLPPPKKVSPQNALPPSISTPASLNSLSGFSSLRHNGSVVFDEEEESVTSILDKVDSMILKSKEDIKGYEKKRREFGGGSGGAAARADEDDDGTFSYQAGSSFHYFPHGRNSFGHHRLRPEGSVSPELVIKGGARRKEGARRQTTVLANPDEEDVIFEL